MNTKTAVINLKIEKNTKEEAQKLASEMGFSLSAVVNASLKQFVRSKELNISTKYTMTKELSERVAQVENDWSKSKNFISANSKKDLDSIFKSL